MKIKNSIPMVVIRTLEESQFHFWVQWEVDYVFMWTLYICICIHMGDTSYTVKSEWQIEIFTAVLLFVATEFTGIQFSTPKEVKYNFYMISMASL